MLTGDQIIEARRILGWPTERLAREARLPFNTVRRAELLGGGRIGTAVHAHAIKAALESAGIEFLPSDRVRMRDQRPA